MSHPFPFAFEIFVSDGDCQELFSLLEQIAWSVLY